MPENETWASFFLNAEKFQLRAEFAMIAALGFFDAMEIRVELLLRKEAGGINALKLRDCLPDLSSKRRRR